jgi:sugar lactone lactonase YvrE
MPAESLRVEKELRRNLSDLTFVGSDFSRPECVLTTNKGELLASDRRGGVKIWSPSGASRLVGSADITPNGFAMLRDRSFLVANLAGVGGVWRIAPDGQASPYLTEVDGVRLPGVNFVTLDALDRLWICVSTLNPGPGQYSQTSRDGFIALHDRRGARIVASEMCWTNECRVSADGAHLYVNETFARRLTRFRIDQDGNLSNREVFAEFGPGVFPDGLSFDAAGCAWVVSVGTNRVIRVEPDGGQTIVIEDCDPVLSARLEALHQQNTLDRTTLSTVKGSTLVNISSIAFGGADLRTAFLGSLGGQTIASFRVRTPGLEPVHWRW